jgi:hypothetical protein
MVTLKYAAAPSHSKKSIPGTAFSRLVLYQYPFSSVVDVQKKRIRMV